MKRRPSSSSGKDREREGWRGGEGSAGSEGREGGRERGREGMGRREGGDGRKRFRSYQCLGWGKVSIALHGRLPTWGMTWDICEPLSSLPKIKGRVSAKRSPALVSNMGGQSHKTTVFTILEVQVEG